MNIEQANKLLFLAVLAQSTIDSLEEEIGEFRFKHKKVAKAFLEEQLKLMNKDFGSPEAVDQLINLSVWIKDVFNIMLKVGQRTNIEQQCFESDWRILLEKYKLETK